MNTLRKTILLAGILMLSFGIQARTEEDKRFSMAPVSHNGQPWRIGYYEGGNYIDYQKELIATVRALMKLGWIEDRDIPPQKGEQTRELWRWMASELKGPYIEFVPDAHYTADWDDVLRQQNVTTVMDRLNKKNDLDLMIAMGTWAGKDLANGHHRTPTLVLSASDPLASGIVKSIEDSGFEHVHATLDPDRFERQVRIFHDLVGFKRLGVAYENTNNGRSYAAIDMLEKLSEEMGFTLVTCYTQSDISEIQYAEKSVIDCFQKLVDTSDAIYVTNQGGVTPRSIPALVEIANEHKVPTFSQASSDEVKYGFLISLSRSEFRYLGEFHAETLAKIFNGAKPNELEQRFEEPPKIAINLETAELIGFDPSLPLLGAADEIFMEIKMPE